MEKLEPIYVAGGNVSGLVAVGKFFRQFSRGTT